VHLPRLGSGGRLRHGEPATHVVPSDPTQCRRDTDGREPVRFSRIIAVFPAFRGTPGRIPLATPGRSRPRPLSDAFLEGRSLALPQQVE